MRAAIERTCSIDNLILWTAFAALTTKRLIAGRMKAARWARMVDLAIPCGDSPLAETIHREQGTRHNHKVDGPITVQCLEGQTAFIAEGDTRLVRAGQWLFLPGGVPHTIKGIDDSLMLLTVMFR